MSVNHKLAAFQRRFSGIFGVAARDLATGREIRRNAATVFPAASTIKVPVMIEVFRQVEAGRLDLNAALARTPQHRVGGSGILKDLSPALHVTIRDALTLMIIVSDNTATNMLIDAVGGPTAVNTTMAALSYPSLVLNRRISFTEEGPLALGTPEAFCDLLTALARGEIVTPGACEHMLAIMKRQQYTDIIGRYIPYDGDAFEDDPEHALGIATKSGSVRGVRNDVGVVFPPGRPPYVIALMSRDCADERFWPENEAKLVLARISRLVYDAFTLS